MTTNDLAKVIAHLGAVEIAPGRYARAISLGGEKLIVWMTFALYLGEDDDYHEYAVAEMPSWWTPDEPIRYGWEHVDDGDVTWCDQDAKDAYGADVADYRVCTRDDDDGYTYLYVDLSQAASPIRYSYDSVDDDACDVTPYRTADANHSEMRAAKLVTEYLSAGDEVVSVVPSHRVTADLETGEEEVA